MKRNRILTLALTLFMVLGSVILPNKASAAYRHDDARAMLQLINNFRTGSDAWAYDQNNQKIYYNNLAELQYDYELEDVAEIRAAEIAESFSHTRPNGESCFTAYPSSFNNNAKGENIAYGTYLGYQEAFKLWQETNEDYSNQGHRRNMLSSGFTRVGIACYHCSKGYFWVQEFANGTPTATQPISNRPDDNDEQTTNQTNSTIDGTTNGNSKRANPLKVSPSSKTYTAKSLKKKNKTFKFKVKNAQGKVSYKSNSSKIKVKNGKVTVKKGIKAGTYYVTITAKGNSKYNAGTAQIKITVK